MKLIPLSALVVFLTAWWLWPLPLRWSTHSAYFSDQITPDFHLIVWALTWDSRALLREPLHLFQANLFYPFRLSLACSEHFLGHVPLFAPTYWATGNPILATNLLIVLTYPLCVAAMYCLARRFCSPAAAFVAAFLYAFCGWRYSSLGHFHMLGVQYLPLAILFTERWLQSGRRLDLLLLSISLLLQALSSFYLAYCLVIGFGPYLLAALWRSRATLLHRRLGALALALGSVGLVLGLTSLPYLELRRVGLIRSYDEATRYGEIGLGTINLVPYFAARSVWRYLTVEGVGPAGYALGVVALLPPWRSRRWALSIGLLFVIVGTLFAFGPTIWIRGHEISSPFGLLRWLPGFSTIRLPIRFTIIAHLGFSLIAGLGAGRLLDRLGSSLAWLGALGLMVATLVALSPLPPIPLHEEVTGESLPPVYRWLADNGGERAVLEIPQGDTSNTSQRMYLSTYHWQPIIGGYSAYCPNTAAYLYSIASRLPDADALQDLVDNVDLGWVVVHGHELPDLARWQAPASLPAGLELVGRWNGDLLFRVTRAVSMDRRARFLSTTETPGGAALARLGRECPGALRVVSGLPNPWTPRSTARLTIELRNAGSVAWPGLAFYPRHLVRLRATLTKPTGELLSWREFALAGDVLPGAAMHVLISLQAPAGTQDMVLTIGLVQVMDAPLSDCGVEPLRLPVRVAPPA